MPRTRQVSDDLTIKLRDLERRLAVAETRSSIPAGSITATGRVTAPTGWLLCDGSAVSRSDFSGLFDAIGTAYGAGDGSATFNLPDFRGRFPLGKAAAGTGSTLGGTGGTIDHIHDLGSTPGTQAHAQVAWLAAGAGVRGRRITVAGYTSTHSTGAAAGAGAAETTGTALAGDTNTANPPFVTVNVMIKI